MKTYKYYGWNGYNNFGDDIIEHIAKYKGFKFNEDSSNLFISGGTLLPLFRDQLLYKRKIEGKKIDDIVVYGTGVENPTNEDNLNFTREFLKNTKLIGLRDEASREALQMGKVIGDPFFHLDYKIVPQNMRQEYVVINVSLNSDLNKTIGGIDAQLNYMKEVAHFTKEILIDKLKLKIVPLILDKTRDVPYAQLLTEYIGIENILRLDDNIFNVLGNAKLAITYKQHGLISALCTNTPVIPIEYHTKVGNVARDFGIETIKLDKVTRETLHERFRELDNFPLERIRAKISEYKKLGNEFIGEIQNEN